MATSASRLCRRTAGDAEFRLPDHGRRLEDDPDLGAGRRAGQGDPTGLRARTFARLAAEHPSVPLVISQLGGLHWITAIELAKDRPNIYIELSTAPTILAVRLAVHELPTRTLFGSDAPYGDPVVARTVVERVTRPGELRDRVLGGTLEELLSRRGQGR